MTNNIYRVYAQGYPKINSDKDKRSLSWSPHQFVPFYLKKEQTVNVVVSGKTAGKVFAVIGLPSDSSTYSTHLLVEGKNEFFAKHDGLLSFINYNEIDDVSITINSSHQRVPYFKTYLNSNKDWDEEMARYSNAPYVILSNDFSDIIVRYSSAKKYIKNAHELMKDNDRIMEVENTVSGYIKNGKADYKLDRNRCLHLEADRLYMFATHGYTGYNEKNGAMPQLLGLSNDRWGIWHENGHQRQQSPWKWNNLTEVTVNIYSLYVQENLTGRATRFDSNYAAIKKFIEKENKSYDTEDLFVKLGLFWQLHLTFGDQFYPQLHQVYRRMHNTPSGDDSEAQKQLFIITVSNLVNVDLSPFFTKWGVYSDLKTIINLSFLPKLTMPIWQSNNDNYYRLPMPEPRYIPQLLYFKDSISDVNLTKNNVSFTIDTEWYKPYKYTFRVNGVYAGEINDGIAHNCNSTLIANGYRIKLNVKDELFESDIFTVDVDFLGIHIIYSSSMEVNDLWQDVKDIYTNEHFSALKNDTDQHVLDELWQRYEHCQNEYTDRIKNKLLLAQQLLLHSYIKADSYHGNDYFIEFTDESFKNYSFVAIANDKLLSELIYGNVGTAGSINERLWKIPVDKNKKIDIIANIQGHDFLVRQTYLDSFYFSNKIEALYIDRDNEIIKGSVTQNEIDDLTHAIDNSDLPHWTQKLLINELHAVQRLYLSGTISEAYESAQNVSVFFKDNIIFRNYKYHLLSDKVYVSEVTYGKAYYSSLNNQLWRTTLKESQRGALSIVVYVNDFWHTIYVFSDETKNIFFDSQDTIF